MLAVSQRVRDLDNGTKAVYFDPERVRETLGADFNIGSFREGDEDEEDGDEDDDDAEPLSAVAPGDESVTVEGRVTDRHTDQPDQIAEKATIVDETDEITVTVWADANKPTLEEGQAYRLKNVVVDEFDGQREVQVNQHSGIVKIQDGAGNVPTADPGANAQLDAKADGGEAENDQPADAADLEQLKPMIAKYVTEQQRNYPEGVPHELVLGEFVAEGHDPGAVESAIERAQRDGAIAEYASGGYINGS